MNRSSIPISRAAFAVALALAAGCTEKVPEKARRGAAATTTTTTAAAPAAPAATPAPSFSVAGKKVLVVHSYHPGFAWVGEVDKGIASVLESQGVQIEHFYMDTKRRPDEAWKVEAGAQARAKLDTLEPDVVITVDDNAQAYFATKLVNQDQPVVFCGVNADPSKYGFPAKNVTGVIERPHLQLELDYLRQLRPVKKIAILTPADETSVGAVNFMKEEAADVEVVEWRLESDYDQWLEAVKRFNTTVDAFGVYTYHTVKKAGQKQSVDGVELMKATIEAAKVPTFAFFEFGAKDGLLMGVVESGLEQGELAGKHALTILRGTPPSQLPVIKAEPRERIANKKTAKRLGITLPAEMLRGAVVEE